MDAGAKTPPPSADAVPSVWTFGRAELDEHRHELRVDGRAVALEAKPFALLRFLLLHAGETLSSKRNCSGPTTCRC